MTQGKTKLESTLDKNGSSIFFVVMSIVADIADTLEDYLYAIEDTVKKILEKNQNYGN
jgi:hypothetical protein